MNVTRSQSQTITIRDAPGLDPVTVFLQHFGENRYRVTVECYGQAWSTFFGNIGDVTIEHFLSTCGGGQPHYLVTALIRGARQHMLSKHVATQDAYLTQIVAAIREALADGVRA